MRMSEFNPACLRLDGTRLLDASESQKRDPSVVMMAVTENGRALASAAPHLRHDRRVVLAAVQNAGGALEYASLELRADKMIALEAARRFGAALLHAAEPLWDDSDFVERARGISTERVDAILRWRTEHGPLPETVTTELVQELIQARNSSQSPGAALASSPAGVAHRSCASNVATSIPHRKRRRRRAAADDEWRSRGDRDADPTAFISDLESLGAGDGDSDGDSNGDSDGDGYGDGKDVAFGGEGGGSVGGLLPLAEVQVEVRHHGELKGDDPGDEVPLSVEEARELAELSAAYLETRQERRAPYGSSQRELRGLKTLPPRLCTLPDARYASLGIRAHRALINLRDTGRQRAVLSALRRTAHWEAANASRPHGAPLFLRNEWFAEPESIDLTASDDEAPPERVVIDVESFPFQLEPEGAALLTHEPPKPE